MSVLPPKDQPFLTTGEVAHLLRTSRRAVYQLVRRQQIPGHLRLGRRLLFDRAVLLDWLQGKRASSAKGGS